MPSPVTLKIKFKSASLQQFIERYSVDVSKGGIFIRTPKPLTVGTALKFEFQLQDGTQLMTGNGTVVWIREADPDKAGVAPGMGVRFDSLPPEGQKVLEQVLAQKQQAMDFSDQPTRVAASTDTSAMAEERPAEPEPEPVFVATDPPKPEPAPQPPAAPPPQPAPEPAQPPKVEATPVKAPEPVTPLEEEPEAARKERLAKILFASDDAPEPDEPPPHYPDADRDLEPSPIVEEERKSSMAGWVVIVLLVGACVAAYFLFLHTPSKPKTTAAKPDATPTVQASQDSAPSPASKPAGVKQKVTSEPEGAKILVDGKDTGKVTPADLDLEAEKEVEIRLDLPGKKLFTKKVTPSSETAVETKLDKPSVRRVQLVSDPAGAMVMLNGVKLGKAPMDYKKPLPKGKVEVIFRLDGYHEGKKELGGETWTREGDDEVLSISVTLEKKEAVTTPPKVPAKIPVKQIKRQPRPKPEPKDNGDEPKTKPEPKPDVPDVTPDTKPEPKPKKKVEKKKAEPKDDGDNPDPDTKKGAVKKPSWSD